MTSTPPDDHDLLREKLGVHALGGLDGAERIELEAHLDGCASCRAELARIAPLAGPLSRIDPDAAPEPSPDPSPAGFAAILDRIRAEEGGDAGTPGIRFGPPPVADRDSPAPAGRPGPDGTVTPLPRRGRDSTVSPARFRLAAAAAVIAIVGLGAGYGVGSAAGQGPSPEPVTVQALAPGIEASAGTIDHTWGVEMVLTASGFAPGEVYRVAVLDRSGRPVDAGAFVGTGASEMHCRLSSPVLRAQADGFVVTDAAGAEVLRSRFV